MWPSQMEARLPPRFLEASTLSVVRGIGFALASLVLAFLELGSSKLF